MRKFIINTVLFVFPITLVLLICLFILLKAGELYDFNDLQPLNEKQYFGLAYSDVGDAYKFKMTNLYYKSDVVALGSSRIMQIKKGVINKQYSFYNAGGAVNNIYKYKLFLDKLNYKPKLFIISIDQWFFNPNYNDQRATFNDDCYEERDEVDFFNTCKLLFIDIFRGKISFKRLMENTNNSIGMNAIINNNGFTSDGSYYYGGCISNPSKQMDFNFKDTYKRIEEKRSRFEQCNHADTTVCDGISAFLDECEKNGIAVIGILPPFAPAINEKMRLSGGYKYMDDIYEILSPIFSNHNNCYVFDYTDMRIMGIKDCDFVDGFHGSELIYNFILQDICKKNENVQEYFVAPTVFDSICKEYISKQIRFHNL